VAKADALPAAAHSFAAVDADNVSVTTCKLAENNGDGFIVRMVETRGLKTTVHLTLPSLGGISEANETSLVEDDVAGAALEVVENSIKLELPPYGVKTVRVQKSGRVAPAVGNVTAKPLSDLEVTLEWAPVPGAAFYRVHRDTVAGFTPSALTLVATTAESRYLDRARDHVHAWIINRLTPETTYYYRVEAVTRSNQRGPASAEASTTTLATAAKACAPQAVRDLHAILVSPNAPVNQVNLLWRSNVEPTVVGYEVHRSTTADFVPSQDSLLAEAAVVVSGKSSEGNRYLDHQMYLDAKPALATTYYYRVCAINSSGARGAFSSEASVLTKAAELINEQKEITQGQDLLGNDAAAE